MVFYGVFGLSSGWIAPSLCYRAHIKRSAKDMLDVQNRECSTFLYRLTGNEWYFVVVDGSWLCS